MTRKQFPPFHFSAIASLGHFAKDLRRTWGKFMSDCKIGAIFIMFIIIYPNNFKGFVCLCFSVYEIVQLFLNNSVFILDSSPDFAHSGRVPLVSSSCVVSC